MRTSSRSLAVIRLIVLLSASALGQTAPANAPRLDYSIGITDAQRHLFHIKIAVSNSTARTLDISMPAWTPGWYTIKPYSANVIKLQAHDNGKRLPLRAIDKQTYRIETGGVRAFTIEYDYFANDMSVNGAELTAKRGYFVGTNLFFYVPGHTTDTTSTVKFDLPAGWRIATGLKRAAEPNTFTARNFDNLVDCPVILGDFDEDVTSVDGKTIHVVVDQKGGLSEENRVKLKDLVHRVVDSQAKMFGGLPYNDYWVLFVGGDTLKTGGALEHENSTNLTYRQIPDDPVAGSVLLLTNIFTPGTSRG
jgi:predicted metalloprotease with PDZ domain